MNPLFQSYQQQQANQGAPANLQEMLRSMASQVASSGMTPEQIVRQKIQNGEISQAQFEWASRIADQWTGRRR